MAAEGKQTYELSIYQPLRGPLIGKTNNICTSKYTWRNFLVINVFEQFHSLANIYFLVLMIFQCIPQISITLGKPTLALPLSIVLAVGAVKDAVEDYRKHEADRAENENRVQRLDSLADDKSVFPDPANWPEDQWQKVHPGDLLKLKAGQRVPADLLLLDSQDASRNCSVETMNLDGETNLKSKACALPEGLTWRTLRGFSISFEPPSSELYEFRGVLSKREQSGEQTIGISISNLLLRGSTVMETENVIGLAIYTGHDTRIMRNSRAARLKRSQLDKAMNSVMILIFVFELLLCILAGLIYVFWEVDHGDEHWYLQLTGQDARHPAYAWAVKTGTWILQMSNMVPISLMVSITVVKFAQGSFVSWDWSMRDKLRNRSAEVHCSQVLESLGQITHVFSDKTGTLTCNEMRYKACSVYQEIYGLDKKPNSSPYSTHVDFNDVERFLQSLVDGEDDRKVLTAANFLLCHAVCHTVKIANDATSPAERGDDKSRVAAPHYTADSPDELALIFAADKLGLRLVDVKGNIAMCLAGAEALTVVLRVADDRRLQNAIQLATGFNAVNSQAGLLEVQVYNICEFDNVRKRMSVVCKYPNGKILLLMKGADSSILRPDLFNMEEMQVKCATHHLLRFAQHGLRTLCLACRELPPQEYNAWQIDYKKASEDMSEQRAELVSQQIERIESQAKGLQFLGATAIEDRLQDQVPQVIADLRMADIMVWVLTGDKMETAISIGKSCKLLTPEMIHFELDSTDELVQHLEQVSEIANGAERSPNTDVALTISGAVLGRVLQDDALAGKFFHASRRCKSVLCCRVSPKQKAQVVESAIHYYQNDDPVTLAIGDGANDVAMITTAHVGVGLSGKEGAQAARAADFSFSEFRFLRRLLFLHGIESYRRNAVLICYNFYKNMILVMAPYFYGWYMSFSGQPYYDQVLFQCYNVVFTCVPIVFYALFDRAQAQEAHEKKGSVDYAAYRRGRAKEYFNRNVFLVWMIAGIIQAFFLTAVAFWTLGDGTMDRAMTSGDLWTVGTVVFMWVIVSVSVTLWNRMTLTFWFQLVAFVISCLLCPAAEFVMSDIVGTQFLRGTFSFMYGQGVLRFLVATVLAMGIHVLVGEPVITLAELPRKNKVMIQEYGKIPEMKEYSQAFADTSPGKSPGGASSDVPAPGTKSSLQGMPVSKYSDSGLNMECAIKRQNTLAAGRRMSREWSESLP